MLRFLPFSNCTGNGHSLNIDRKPSLLSDFNPTPRLDFIQPVNNELFTNALYTYMCSPGCELSYAFIRFLILLQWIKHVLD